MYKITPKNIVQSEFIKLDTVILLLLNKSYESRELAEASAIEFTSCTKIEIDVCLLVSSTKHSVNIVEAVNETDKSEFKGIVNSDNIVKHDLKQELVYYPIGTIIEYKDKVIEIVKATKSCNGCVFSSDDLCPHAERDINCVGQSRKDRTNIILKIKT